MLTVGLDYILPLRSVKTWSNEPPWMTPELSSLIKKRQIALKQGNTLQFKYLRNRVNREEKKIVSCKVLREKCTTSQTCTWWDEVKKQSITRKVYNISNHQLGGMRLRNLVEVNPCIKIMKKFLEH